MSHPIMKPDLAAASIVAAHYGVDVTSVNVRYLNTGFRDDFALGILSHVNGVLTYMEVTTTGTMTTGVSTFGFNVTATDVFVPI